jgi:hypothetical protein
MPWTRSSSWSRPRTVADRAADPDLGDVAHPDRRPLLGRDHDVGDVVGRLDEADAADGEGVLPAGDVAAAGVGIVGGHGVEDLLEGEVVAAQPPRVDGDLILLDAAAPGDDVHHARDLPELALEDPVLERLQLHERQGLRLEGVAIDFPDHAGERAEAGLGIRRDFGLADTFLDLLARPVVVGAVGEQGTDVRHAEVRDRAEEGDAGDPVQLLLERDRDVALHLLGGVTRPQRDDVDLDVRHVGIRLDRQAIVVDDSAVDEEDGKSQDHETLMQRKRDDARDHRARVKGRTTSAWWRVRASRTSVRVGSLNGRPPVHVSGVGDLSRR